MKGIGKIILVIAGLACFFLVYVREQVALLHVSYAIDTKNEKLNELSEDYRHVRFEVDQLKAPRLLEEKIKQMQLDLTLPQEIRVVRLPASFDQQTSLQQIATRPMAGRLTDFLGHWIGIAQAKTDR